MDNNHRIMPFKVSPFGGDLEGAYVSYIEAFHYRLNFHFSLVAFHQFLAGVVNKNRWENCRTEAPDKLLVLIEKDSQVVHFVQVVGLGKRLHFLHRGLRGNHYRVDFPELFGTTAYFSSFVLAMLASRVKINDYCRLLPVKFVKVNLAPGQRLEPHMLQGLHLLFAFFFSLVALISACSQPAACAQQKDNYQVFKKFSHTFGIEPHRHIGHIVVSMTFYCVLCVYVVFTF